MRRSYRRVGLALILPLTVVALVLVSGPGVSGSPVSQVGQTANFTLSPPNATLNAGQTVDVTIQFDASQDAVSAAQAYLNFNSTVLQVVDPSTGLPTTAITPGPIFTSNDWSVLQNQVDNSTGTINFAGGKNPGTGSNVTTLASFATFRFEALTSTASAAVTFSTVAPRQTKAVSGFDDATGTLTGMTVTVNNTAPVAGDDGFATDEDTAITTGNVLTNDSDADAGDTLSVVSVDTSLTLGLVTNNGDGTFGYDPNGQFEALAAGEPDTDTFTYTVGDGNGGTDTATVTINITGVNDAPVADNDGGAGFGTDEDTAFTTGNVLTNDTDPDASDVLSVVSVDTSLTQGLVTNNGDGTFGYDPNGQFEALAAGEPATDTFTYTVGDGNGGSSTATVTIDIVGVNEDHDVTLNFSIQGVLSTGSPSSWNMPFNVEFYSAGTSTVVTSDTPTSAASTNSSSSFIFPAVPGGTYDVWAKGENTLSQLLNGVAISQSSTVVDLGEQAGGDATGGAGGAPDDVVDSADYSGLLVVFGSLASGLAPDLQRYDFNQDGTIDVVDYSIVVANFGQGGAAKP